MNISYNGFEYNALTFNAASTIAAGDLVIPAANRTVTKSGEDDEFAGVVVQAENGIATVQMKGVVTVPYSGTISAPGYYTLVADDSGKATPGEDGKVARLVLNVDSTAGKIEILL